MIKRIEIVAQENYIIPVKETEVTKKAKNLEKNIAKLQKVKTFWIEYVKTTATMVIAKVSNKSEVWYIAFLKFFLYVLNKFNRNYKRKQRYKKEKSK